MNFSFVVSARIRLDNRYTQKTVQVRVEGNRGTFYYDDCMRWCKIYDIKRISKESFKEIIEIYKQKQNEFSNKS